MADRKFRVFATSQIGEAIELLRQRGYEVEVFPGPEAPPKKLIVEKTASGIDGLITTLRDMENGAPPVEQGWSGIAARIRLLCTVYDRASGIYRPDYSLIVGMLVGASILGSVVYLLGSEWRRQRRRVP